MSDMLKGTPNEPRRISDEDQEYVLDITSALGQDQEPTQMFVYKFPDDDDPEHSREAERQAAATQGTGMLEFVTAKQYFDQLIPSAGDVQPDERLTENMLDAIIDQLKASGAHHIEAKWIATQALSVIVEDRQIAAERAERKANQ